MPAKPPLYSQDTDYSCAPACLRMVLSAAGVEKSETELREVCNCDIEGTLPSDLVKAAKSFGFGESKRGSVDFDQLKSSLAEGLYPIVYLKIRVGVYLQTHAVVVIEILPNELKVLDPARGEITISETNFLSQWSAARHETIVVK
jgi:ABC-type bacteriocin/lantibiotic exporter with double-glycine peptidase domain